MGHGGAHVDKAPGQFTITNNLKTVCYALMFVGLISLIVGLINAPGRIWPSYLTSMFYFTSLTLGGMFFVAVNHAANAGWSVNIRRFAEAFSAYTPVILVSALVLFLGIDHLYPWADAERMANDHLLHVKEAYLNRGFVITRWVIFGAGIWYISRVIVGNSLKQDETGDETLTKKTYPWAVGYIAFFALAFSFFAVDTLMALLPYWYSTIFGIYVFAAGFQSALAMIILLILWSMDRGLLKGLVSIDHVHDVAKYLKGFTVFWAYIAFSQFLLIWYTNIPEETEFYHMRMHGEWTWISLSLIVFRFAVPFLALLPRWAKRTPAHLRWVCLMVLVMHYVDIFWIVYPNFNDHHLVFGFYELGAFAFFFGLFLFLVTRFLSSNPLVPLKDPRRAESYHHHVTY